LMMASTFFTSHLVRNDVKCLGPGPGCSIRAH
jgi:hypothetical protein